jgi:D-alanine-D-alanine ligase-like ATP-grasp enzyme
MINFDMDGGHVAPSHDVHKGRRRDRLRVGLAFNEKPRWEPSPQDTDRSRDILQTQNRTFDDSYAEWDEPSTIAAVEDALSEVGEVVRLEAKEDFPFRLYEARPDMVFNIAEGLRGPNREAHVPAFCEFWGIPYTGSDPMSLSTCLHKGRAKDVLMRSGVRTPEFGVISRDEEVALADAL